MQTSSGSSSSAVETKAADVDDHQHDQYVEETSPTLIPTFDVGLLDQSATGSFSLLRSQQDSEQWRDILTTGSRVDAQDGDSMWYESIIEESTPENVTVRFLGWSRKWNALLPRDSRRIAPRNTKVPNWRQTLTPGKCVEVSTSDSCTWCTAVVSVVEPTRFQVIRAPACTTEWHDINSPLIAEPYTHCGYKIEADARERRRMLAARRNLFNVELQICYDVRAMSSRIRVAQSLGEYLLGIPSEMNTDHKSGTQNEHLSSATATTTTATAASTTSTTSTASTASTASATSTTFTTSTTSTASTSSTPLYDGEPPFSDVTFVVGGERIHAHRAIVISRSPYFHRMFLGGMKEATESKGNEITIADTTPSTFRCVIKYMYTGLCNVHHNNALELLHSAHLFCLDGLAKAIEVFLFRAISTETAMEIIVAANTFSLVDLEAHCVEYIIDHYEMFVPHLSKLATHPQILIMIMESMRKPKKRRSKPNNNGSSKEGEQGLNLVDGSNSGRLRSSSSSGSGSGGGGGGGNNNNGGSSSGRKEQSSFVNRRRSSSSPSSQVGIVNGNGNGIENDRGSKSPEITDDELMD